MRGKARGPRPHDCPYPYQQRVEHPDGESAARAVCGVWGWMSTPGYPGWGMGIGRRARIARGWAQYGLNSNVSFTARSFVLVLLHPTLWCNPMGGGSLRTPVKPYGTVSTHGSKRIQHPQSRGFPCLLLSALVAGGVDGLFFAWLWCHQQNIGRGRCPPPPPPPPGGPPRSPMWWA